MVIPAKYQASVLPKLHLNLPGMVRMKSLARLHVWWSILDHDAEQTSKKPMQEFYKSQQSLDLAQPSVAEDSC